MKNFPDTRRGLPGVTLAVMLAGIFMMTILAGPVRAQTALPAPWTSDWNSARERAAREQLPLLAMFSAEWSPPCEEVLTNLLPIKDVRDRLAANWVPVFVDEKQYGELHKQYRIRALPTFVIFNLEGGEHTRFVGSREPADFLGKLQEGFETMVELAQIREALKKDRNNPFLHKAHGDLLLDLGRFEPAEEAYEEARRYDPDNKTGVRADLLFLDGLKEASKNPAGGLRMFEELNRNYPASPRNADALYVSAMIELEQLENLERGRLLLEQYLKLHPEGRFAEIAQEQLKTIENRR